MLGSKQNAGSLVTTVFDTDVDALLHGTLGFTLNGCYVNHFLIGGNSSTAIRLFEISGYVSYHGKQMIQTI